MLTKLYLPENKFIDWEGAARLVIVREM